jgi:hypothetical protein
MTSPSSVEMISGSQEGQVLNYQFSSFASKVEDVGSNATHAYPKHTSSIQEAHRRQHTDVVVISNCSKWDGCIFCEF